MTKKSPPLDHLRVEANWEQAGKNCDKLTDPSQQPAQSVVILLEFLNLRFPHTKTKMNPSLTVASFILLLLANIVVIVSPFELKVCSAEDLRKSIEEVCIRFSRDKGSLLNLNGYGSMLPVEDEPLSGRLDSAREKRNSSGVRLRTLVKRHRERVTRDYVDTCCSKGCEIDADDLSTICSSV